MDPETAARLASYHDTILLLAAVVVGLCCYILGAPEIDKRLDARVKPAVEFCKLHSRPVTECADQHKERAEVLPNPDGVRCFPRLPSHRGRAELLTP